MSAPVSGPIAIGALELAALLCSRVCHDLISPVGAIVNGLEVMEEDKDEETKTFALDLIKKSAHRPRPSCNSAGWPSARPARRARRSISATPKRWRAGCSRTTRPRSPGICRGELLPKNRVKLLLNMLLIAAGTIPRGGTLTVDPVRSGGAMPAFVVTAAGLNARLNRPPPNLLAGSPAHAGRCPCASSRSIPASWRGIAGLRYRQAAKARRWS